MQSRSLPTVILLMRLSFLLALICTSGNHQAFAAGHQNESAATVKSSPFGPFNYTQTDRNIGKGVAANESRRASPELSKLIGGGLEPKAAARKQQQPQQLEAGELTGPIGVQVNSKTGRVLARMQIKRQTQDDSQPKSGAIAGKQLERNRRNEDPWFLDQAPYPLQPYRFVYNIKGKNGQTEQYRQEVGDGKYLSGSYGYVLPDGIYRHVDYVADDRGFRAFIRTSEPGTANQNPANVVIQANPLVVAPGVTYVAPDLSGGPPGGLAAGPIQPLGYSDNRAADYSLPFQSQANSNFNFNANANINNADQLDLIRRPIPGSIVGNALRPNLRNFTSFTFTTPSPPLASLSQSLPGSSFGPLLYRGDQFSPGGGGGGSNATSSSAREQATGGRQVSGAFGPSANQQQWDDEPFQSSRMAKSAPRVEQQRPQPQQPANLRWSYLGGLQPISAPAPLAANQRRAPAFEFNQRRPIGPNTLAYDRPLSGQGGENGGHPKLAYDNDHELSAGGYLALERARSLAQLEAAGRIGLIRGGFSANPINRNQILLSDSIGQLAPLAGGASASRSTAEHHRQHSEGTSSSLSEQEENGRLISRVLISKEHQSGSQSGSARDFELHQTKPPSNNGSDRAEDLPVPPAPIFQHQFRSRLPGESAGGGATKGGRDQRQQQQLQLQAPYAGFAQQLQLGKTSFSYPPALDESSSSSSPPPPPRPPADHSLAEDQYRFGGPTSSTSSSPGSSSTTSTSQAPDQSFSRNTQQPVDSQELARSTTKSSAGDQQPVALVMARDSGDNQEQVRDEGSKGGGGLRAGKSQQAQNAPVRTIRMPEDFRVDLAMNDLRSMQNTFGLPQPPRLQPPAGSSPLNGATNLGSKLSLADQLISARLGRVESLLIGSGPDQAGGRSSDQARTQNAGQTQTGQASVRRAIAVTGPENSASDQLGAAKLEPPRRKLSQTRGENDVAEEKMMMNENEAAKLMGSNLNTGPLIRLPSTGAGDSLLFDNLANSIANETFDARRLYPANSKLQAEKVSELEKFQQRLRTQQLLLEQAKQVPGNNFDLPAKQPLGGALKLRNLNELLMNSQVKYDEESASKPGDLSQQQQLGNAKSGEFARLAKRQNDSGRIELNSTGSLANNNTSAQQVELSASVSPRQKNLSILSNAIGGSSKSNDLNSQPNLSEFAKQIQNWPSLANSTDELSSLISGPAKTQPGRGGQSGKEPAREDSAPRAGAASIEHQPQAGNQSRPSTGANTINLDFINSVTALSVDQMNPFAVASVNPAIQRSNLAHSGQPIGGRQGGVAIANARYFSSPELLAALDYHEQSDTSAKLRNLLPLDQASGVGWPSNHRLAGAGSHAPYTMSLASARPIGPSMSEAANSQHKTFAPMPRRSVDLIEPGKSLAQLQVNRSALGKQRANESGQSAANKSGTGEGEGEGEGGKVNNKAQMTASKLTSSLTSSTRDGFEISDRAYQVDNHRFYEVVSSGEPASGFQAFTDAELSIPALASR